MEDGVAIMNESDVETSAAMESLWEQHPEVAALVRWSSSMGAPKSRQGNLIQRDRYVAPENVFEQMKLAYYAAENDDIVSGVLEGTESLAFSRMSVDTEVDDETDIWQQIAEDIDLDRRIREMWRENFIVSQTYCAAWWGQKDYRVSGKAESGIKRKRQFKGLQVPLGMTILDPLKVVPVGNHLLFNKDRLAYIADNREYDQIMAVINGDTVGDPMMRQIILEPYEPDDVERRLLTQDGISASNLFELNPKNCWRHTDTRSQYQRFATIRLKSIFELLDLKAQLRAMDRAMLLASTNYLLVIKKGSDTKPATNPELAALQRQVQTLARVPVMIGDHRLSVEIVTPKADHTLEPERYNGIDSRITARLYQLFSSGSYSSGTKGDDSIKLAKMVARGLESRREMLKKTIERNVFYPTYELNDAFTQRPSILFHPKRIALDFDPVYANFILDLLDRGHISRESGLEEVDYDQMTERRRRQAEKKYDEDFAPRAAPGASNLGGPNADPKAAGRRQGGVKNGGGRAGDGSGQGQAPRDPSDLSDDD